MTKSRGILTPRRKWRDEEKDMLRARYADSPAAEIAKQLGCKVHVVYKMAEKLGLKKSEQFLRSPLSGRTGFDDRGAAYRFQPGHSSHNAGKVGLDMGGRSHDTRFKKGQKPVNYKPIGSFRVNGEGYLDIKIREDLRGGMNWLAYHRHIWIQANGAVPAGHLIAFKPGQRSIDPAKITLESVECITFEENALRNSIHTKYPKEVVDLIRLKGRITKAIRKREREEQDRRSS